MKITVKADKTVEFIEGTNVINVNDVMRQKLTVVPEDGVIAEGETLWVVFQRDELTYTGAIKFYETSGEYSSLIPQSVLSISGKWTLHVLSRLYSTTDPTKYITQFASDLAEFTIQNGATLEDGNPVTDATVGNLWIEVKEYVKSAESSAVQATNSAARAEEFAEEAEQSAKEATDEIKNTIKPKIEKLEQTDTEIKESLNKKADLEGDNNYTGTQSYGTQDRLKVIVSGTGITFEYGVYKYEITHTGFTEKNYDTGEIYQTINWEDLCSLAQNTARLNRSNTFQDENTFEEAIQAKKGTVVKNSLDETNYNAGYISRNGWTYLFPVDSGTFALKKDIPSPATTEEIEALF